MGSMCHWWDILLSRKGYRCLQQENNRLIVDSIQIKLMKSKKRFLITTVSDSDHNDKRLIENVTPGPSFLQRQKASENNDNSGPVHPRPKFCSYSRKDRFDTLRLKVWEQSTKPIWQSDNKAKVVMKNKNDEDQTVKSQPARLVSKGNAQEEGIDFRESFALVFCSQLEAVLEFSMPHAVHSPFSNLSDGRENGIS
ncbi:hypothetical protein Tco_0053256 [Tanacetum coccineum]